VLQFAADEGRGTLSAAQVATLLTALGLQPTAEGARGATVTELRIGLERAREFGLVLRAGPGGLDADDEGGDRRGTVYAAVELTDAAEFLRLFQRTAIYRKLAALAAPATNADAQLGNFFGALRALAGVDATGASDSGFALRRVELDCICGGG
jgi:hypothetical protein